MLSPHHDTSIQHVQGEDRHQSLLRLAQKDLRPLMNVDMFQERYLKCIAATGNPDESALKVQVMKQPR